MNTIVLGFDAFDPAFFEKLHNTGKTPHLSRLLQNGGYAPFAVSNPPQSEVSWTSIASGADPGSHGIFDFVHRNPQNYGLFVSLLPTQSGPLGAQFVPPHNAETIFEAAVKDGYPAASLWWPATFPARLQSPVQTIPGLGTPDIFGQLGVGVSFAPEPLRDPQTCKTRQASLTPQGHNTYHGTLTGPARPSHSGPQNACLDFELHLLEDDTAQLTLGKQTIHLQAGQWSQILEIEFKMGLLTRLKIVTRALLTRSRPTPALYFLPLQLHPLGSPWPYATPKGMLKQIWQKQGAFLTLGWPQDTTALEEGFINDAQFLDLCEQIFAQRERIFMARLDSHREGLLAAVFDTLDRVQHMFWQRRPDVVEAWYRKLDALAGRVAAHPNAQKAHQIIVSDHGFRPFAHKAHLNRWLIEHGYLRLTAGAAANLSAANWDQTQAYAIGLNSLYLNLQGREGQGMVTPTQKTEVLTKLRAELLQWEGPSGGRVIQNVYLNPEVFSGPLAEHGPDLVVGYAPGYRAAAETGLGGWGEQALSPNLDHWEADHCMDAQAVPGVLFSSRGLVNFPSPSFRDIPALALGKQLRPRQNAAPVGNAEDQAALEERLKGLGYL